MTTIDFSTKDGLVIFGIKNNEINVISARNGYTLTKEQTKLLIEFLTKEIDINTLNDLP